MLKFLFRKIDLSLFLGFFLGFSCPLSFAQPDISLEASCARVFQETQLCPPEGCRLSQDTCIPKDCLEISAEHCPLQSCRLLKGCEGQDVCYYLADIEEPTCGTMGYVGPVECCEGLVKRCGSEFFDGTCDMIGKDSIYSVPICIACGNGMCNQFEDGCNCPEDC